MRGDFETLVRCEGRHNVQGDRNARFMVELYFFLYLVQS